MSGNGRKPRPFRNNKSKAMNTWTAAKQQISKYGVTDLVNAGDLTIEHGALDAEVFGEPCREFCEAAEDVSVSGDQFRTTILKVGEGTEAVDLQLEDVIIGVERLGAA